MLYTLWVCLSKNKEVNVYLLSRILVILVLVSFIFPTGVLASDYGDGYKRYLRTSKLHKAFAIAPRGSWYFVYGQRNSEVAKREALRKCNERLRGRQRSFDCYVVDVNGSFVIPNGKKIMSARMAIPVNIEIFDGKTNKLQKTRGFLLPHYQHGQKLERNIKLNIITSNKQEICRGKYSIVSRGEKYKFRITCFNKYNFSGVAETGTWKKYGYFRAPTFVSRLEHGSSYMKLSTR